MGNLSITSKSVMSETDQEASNEVVRNPILHKTSCKMNITTECLGKVFFFCKTVNQQAIVTKYNTTLFNSVKS